MSAWIFDTCNASALGEFIESPLHERNAEGAKDGYIYQGRQGPEEGGEYANDLWMYRYAGDSWTERAKPKWKGSRGDFSSPAVGGAAYSMADGSRHLRAIRRYKPDGWIEMNEGPDLTMSGNGFQTYKGKIYGRVRGDFGEDRAAMFAYDTKQDKWTRRAAATERFDWFSIHTATLGDKGYYYGGGRSFGGEKGRVHEGHVRFSPTDDSYRTMEDMLEGIDRGTGGGLDGWAFLMGGHDYELEAQPTTRAYNPSQNSWKLWKGNQSEAAPMSGPRDEAAAFILPHVHSIFVTGGSLIPSREDLVQKTNLRFDVKKDTWQTMKKPIPTARYRHGAFAL